MERNESLLEKIDGLLQTVLSLKSEYLLLTASEEERICGVWIREGSKTSFRIYSVDGKRMIDTRTSNPVDDRMRITTHVLEKDGRGSMFFGFMEYAVAYNREQDVLTVESYGKYQRKIEEHHEK